MILFDGFSVGGNIESKSFLNKIVGDLVNVGKVAQCYRVILLIFIGL
jgi:hypothetical protein